MSIITIDLDKTKFSEGFYIGYYHINEERIAKYVCECNWSLVIMNEGASAGMKSVWGNGGF